MKKLSRYFFKEKKWRAVSFDYAFFEVVLTLTMSKTLLFSTHVFTKEDFDLAVLTASLIKTFKEIDMFSIL